MQAEAKAVILMYHRIARVDLDPWSMCVAPERFSEQLDAIKRVARPMSLPGRLPERAVVVTFDDGYVDNFEQAVPILRQHEVPATFFVSTGNIDTAREFWWDRLETLLLGIGTLPDPLELQLPSETRRWALGEAANYSAADQTADRFTNPWSAEPGTRLGVFYEVWKTLWPLPEAARAHALDRLAAVIGVEASPAPSRRTLSSDEIRSMGQDTLVEIGAHTVNHPPLSAHDVSEQSEQILNCRDQLQQILGCAVTSFAYPHGKFSPDTIRLLRESGFECAVTTEHKLADRSCDAMQLPRFGVKDVGGNDFLSQLREWFKLPSIDPPAA